LASYEYTIGDNGERLSCTELGRTVEYTYDELERLTSETVTVGSEVSVTTYTYDSNSNPDSIQNNYWLFELTNYDRDIVEDKKKGASMFVFIAPRELNAEETEKLKEFEQNDPEFVKGVKEGWSILFIGNKEYVIMPGIVSRSEIISKIPESVKNNNPDIIYYNTDNTIVF